MLPFYFNIFNCVDIIQTCCVRNDFNGDYEHFHSQSTLSFPINPNHSPRELSSCQLPSERRPMTTSKLPSPGHLVKQVATHRNTPRLQQLQMFYLGYSMYTSCPEHRKIYKQRYALCIGNNIVVSSIHNYDNCVKILSILYIYHIAPLCLDIIYCECYISHIVYVIYLPWYICIYSHRFSNTLMLILTSFN